VFVRKKETARLLLTGSLSLFITETLHKILTPITTTAAATTSIMPASSPQYLKSQLARATALEARLKDCANEEEASQLRIQLCEVFSDVMLMDPSFCLQKDCFGRLWRNCFYARIGELRSRISRERRKKGSNSKKLEDLLKQFLKEGIQLYKYFVEQYQDMLLPSDSQASEEEVVSMDGVVAGLHRIYIYLGDLYRYSCVYGKAEECYEKASRLAPSKGNPYNQLAVVAQLKDVEAPLCCLALYYYARSLLATHDPFFTSKNNLERMLESNREWLQSTTEESLLEAATKTYAQKVEKARAQKSVASRLFLARFVDLHYDLFRHFKFSERQARDNELVDKMNVVVLKLDLLLKEWAFGDSLLLKMVTINAFSIQWTQSKTLARAFMLCFGASLAERLEFSLKKATEKKTLSLRLLMPLVLLSEYVSTWTLDDDSPDKALSTEAREFCLDAKQRYWTRLASVATQLIPLCSTLGLDEMNVEGMVTLKEYEQFVGFAPFDSFVNTREESEDVYLSVEDAVRVLELSQPTQTPPGSSQSQAEDSTLKLKRFFVIVDTMVEKKQPVCCVNGQYRVFSFKSEQEGVEESDDDNVDDNMMMMEDDEQETEKIPAVVLPRIPLQKDGMLEYKRSEGGIGPALLVPGALLLNKATSPKRLQDRPAPVVTTERPVVAMTPNLLQQQVLPSVSRPTVDVAMVERPTVPVPAVAAALLGPPPGLLPPPGFGGPSTAAPGLSVPPMQQQQPPMAVGYGAYPSAQTLPDGDTVLQMLRGMDTNTSNPFMTSSNVDNLFASQSSSSVPEQDMDGMSLLDSSLLNSMMMDDSSSQPRSRNPFLT